VLIDEVDKADIDFPNDLLDVLDRFEFDIEDLPRRGKA
jgi:MoxR-like ATPase